MRLGAFTNSKQLQNKSLEQVPKQNDVISFRLVVFVLSVCSSSRGRTESPNKTRLQTTFERPGVTDGSRCYALLNLSTLSLSLSPSLVVLVLVLSPSNAPLTTARTPRAMLSLLCPSFTPLSSCGAPLADDTTENVGARLTLSWFNGMTDDVSYRLLDTTL